MKNASDHAKRLNNLFKELRKRVEVDSTKPDRDAVQQVIHGFLTWEASHAQADQAQSRMMKSMVDVNDLRVTDPRELVQMLGPRYPRVEERASRLLRTLHAIYLREHVVSLARLTDMPKREAKEYLEGLDGITPYVAASVVLLCLDGHAMPVDEQTMHRLKSDGVIDEAADLATTQGFLEHHIPAAEAIESFYLLRAYVERPIKVDLPGSSRGTTKRVKSTTKKATTKKASTKKTSTKKSPTKKKPTRRG